MNKILLTGFEPFGPYMHNPSADTVRRLNNKTLCEHTVTGIVLECTYNVFDVLQQVIEEEEPDAIISMGLSSSAQGICFERRGTNIMNGKYPDAHGYNPKNIPLMQGGPQFVHANADTAALAEKVRRTDVPVESSDDAGGFACNALLYHTSLYLRQGNRTAIQNVFFHMPWTERYEKLIFGDRKAREEQKKIVIPEKTVDRAIEEIIKGMTER